MCGNSCHRDREPRLSIWHRPVLPVWILVGRPRPQCNLSCHRSMAPCTWSTSSRPVCKGPTPTSRCNSSHWGPLDAHFCLCPHIWHALHTSCRPCASSQATLTTRCATPGDPIKYQFAACMLNNLRSPKWYEARAIFQIRASLCTQHGIHVCSRELSRVRHPIHWSCRYHNSPQMNSPHRAKSRRNSRYVSWYIFVRGKVNTFVRLWSPDIYDHMHAFHCNFSSFCLCNLINGTHQQSMPLDWLMALWEAPSRSGT